MKSMMMTVLAATAVLAVGAEENVAETHPVSVNVRGHENIEWSEYRAFHLTDANRNLPRVLLVGDSITSCYKKRVTECLEGVASVSWWISSYCVASPNYLRQLELMLDEAQYDVIHFNNGLHSFQTDPASWKVRTLEALRLIRRKQPKAKLVYVLSTPVKSETENRKVVEMNRVGGAVAAKFGVDATDDLYTVLAGVPLESRWCDGCHPKQAGTDALVKAVVTCLSKQLGRPVDPARLSVRK